MEEYHQGNILLVIISPGGRCPFKDLIKFCSSFIIYLIPVLFTVVSVFKETLLLLLFGDTGEQAVVVNRFLRRCCVLIPRFIGHSNFSIILLQSGGSSFYGLDFYYFCLPNPNLPCLVWCGSQVAVIIILMGLRIQCVTLLSDITVQDEEEAEVQMKGKSSSWKGERITKRSELKASSSSSS